MPVIVELLRQDLRSGYVGGLFCQGMKTAILKEDSRVCELWDGLLGTRDVDCGKAEGEKEPWENSIFTMALNHQPNNCHVGDMFRFCPGVYGHFARKIKIYPSSNGHRMQTNPNYFSNGNGPVTYPDDLLRMAWELMSDIFKSTLPEAVKPPPYAVAVEILKYPNSLVEMERTFSLIGDAAGGWTQIGQQLDAYKGMAPGIFRKKWLGDLFALASLIPGVNNCLQSLSRPLNNSLQTRIPENAVTIGNDHIDTSKFISGLAGERDVIQTDIYDGKNWLELPLTRDRLAIFPSQKINRILDVAPTRHRILIGKKDGGPTTSKPNVTLSLAIVDR